MSKLRDMTPAERTLLLALWLDMSISVADVAQRLGGIGNTTLYAWVKQCGLPSRTVLRGVMARKINPGRRDWDPVAALAMHRAGMNDNQIARAFGLNRPDCSNRLNCIIVYGSGITAPTTERACIRCRKPHPSTGTGDRFCDDCRVYVRDDHSGPYELCGVRVRESGF